MAQISGLMSKKNKFIIVNKRMCFSKEVSLATFIMGLFTSYLCLTVGTPEYNVIGFFFGFVILMQGIEYILWKHQLCDSLNKNVSLFGMILNHLQPVILFILLAVYLKTDNIDLFVLGLYLLVIIPYSIQFLRDKNCTVKNDKDHLVWKWNQMNKGAFVYIIFLLALCVMGRHVNKTFSIITLASFVISYFIYRRDDVIGAMWCFFAVFAPLFYYIKHKMKK